LNNFEEKAFIFIHYNLMMLKEKNAASISQAAFLF